MDVSKEKYIMANIKIPIEIIENKKCRLFIDLLHIDFTSISELPESITDPVIKEQMQDTLQIFFKAIFPEYSEYNISNVIRSGDLERDDLEKNSELNHDDLVKNSELNRDELDKENILQLYVEKEEIKKMKKPTNITFKIYNKKSRKQYTSKNYDNNGR
jgi:hypothetical protein